VYLPHVEMAGTCHTSSWQPPRALSPSINPTLPGVAHENGVLGTACVVGHWAWLAMGAILPACKSHLQAVSETQNNPTTAALQQLELSPTEWPPCGGQPRQGRHGAGIWSLRCSEMCDHKPCCYTGLGGACLGALPPVEPKSAESRAVTHLCAGMAVCAGTPWVATAPSAAQLHLLRHV